MLFPCDPSRAISLAESRGNVYARAAQVRARMPARMRAGTCAGMREAFRAVACCAAQRA
jgi:hypothetical protein